MPDAGGSHGQGFGDVVISGAAFTGVEAEFDVRIFFVEPGEDLGKARGLTFGIVFAADEVDFPRSDF